MRQEIRLLKGAVLALCLVAIGVVLSCGGSNGAIAVQPPGIPTAYGDGSAGPLNVTADMSLLDANTQYTDVSITGAGTVLTVPSGTVIRCTGTFTIGPGASLFVSAASAGGWFHLFAPPGTGMVASSPATQGLSGRPAGFPQSGGTALFCLGGTGGSGQLFGTQFFRYPGILAGGGGTGADNDYGGAGGGGLTILAFGAVQIAGSLRANGTTGGFGSGGGAGGVVVLASAMSIETTGQVGAEGGDGRASTATCGAGGGGGGGVINLLAPLIVGVDGVHYIVAGGAAGSNVVSVTDALRSGGGGGGACGGNGGMGGAVLATDEAQPAEPGSAGFINRIGSSNPQRALPVGQRRRDAHRAVTWEPALL